MYSALIVTLQSTSRGVRADSDHQPETGSIVAFFKWAHTNAQHSVTDQARGNKREQPAGIKHSAAGNRGSVSPNTSYAMPILRA